MWKQLEHFGVGFLVTLPFIILWWAATSFIRFGDAIFQWLVILMFGKEIPVLALIIFILFCWMLGKLFDIPRIGPLLHRALKKIPFVSAFIQRKEAFKNIKKIWESSGCGPIFISYPWKDSWHPAAITTIFNTDFGFFTIVLIGTIPPQEVYFFENAEVYYGIPASEISAIHMSLGYAAKSVDLRGKLKCATLGKLIKTFNLYQEQTNGAKTNGLVEKK